MDLDGELKGLRQVDAAILASLLVPPDQPRAPGHKLRHALLLRLVGVRGSLRRLERRGYVQPGWIVDYLGVHCQVTELGKRVGGAAAGVLLAGDYGERGSVSMAFLRMRLGRRLGR